MSNSVKVDPKLVIYGVGFVGQGLVRLADKKGWQVVAAFNRPGEKIGKDVGQLAGLDKDLGVLVQDCDTADYSNLDADVALIATTDSMQTNLPAYQHFLSAGINVLCHGGESYSPWISNPELASTIDELAKANGATFTGGGIWDMTRLWSGIIAAGPCVEIDSILHRSTTEVMRQGLHFKDILGVGLSPEEFLKRFEGGNPFAGKFHIPSSIVLRKWGYTLRAVEEAVEPIVWDEPVYCQLSKQEYPAGVVVGARFTVDVSTAEGLNARSEFEYRVFREGEIEDMRWKINGLPGMEIIVVRENSEIASASSLFNRIPDVIAAEPGIKELANMAPLAPTALL
jgi:hypothetical protein